MLKTNEIAAVIFDFDGVLVDSFSVHEKAWRLAAHKVFGVTLSEHIEMSHLMGRATRSISEEICRVLKRAESDVPLLQQTKSAFVKELTNEVSLRSGVKDYIQLLKSKNIPHGIASNAPRDFVRNIAAHNQLGIDIVLGFEDADRPKPAPDLFLRCAELLGIKFDRHSNVIVFEDSTHGLKAAVQARMYPVGVTSMHSSEVLIHAGAKSTIVDFSELGSV